MQYESLVLPSGLIRGTDPVIHRMDFHMGSELAYEFSRITNDKKVLQKIILLTAYSVFMNRMTGQKNVICSFYRNGKFSTCSLAVDESLQIRELMNNTLNIWKCENCDNVQDRSCVPVLADGEHSADPEYYSIVFDSDKVSMLYRNEVYSDELMKFYGNRFLHIVNKVVFNMEKTTDMIKFPEDNGEISVSQYECGRAVSIDTDSCWISTVQKQAEKNPDKIAVYSRDGNVTYHELICMAEHMRNELRKRGCRENDRIAVFCSHSPFTVAAVIAVASLGAYYVPVDEHTPEQRVQELLSENSIGYLLCNVMNIPDVKKITLIPVLPDKEEIPVTSVTGKKTGYMIFTSGTTGKPKGILIDESKLMNLCLWYSNTFDLNIESRVILLNNFNFDASVKNIYTPLMKGASVVCTRDGLYNTYSVIEDIMRFKVTHVNCVPSLMAALLDTARHENFRHLESVKQTILGGDVFETGPIRLWAASENCHSFFGNVYGPAECTSVSTYYLMDRNDILSTEKVPVGRPIWNKKVYVLSDNLKKVPKEVQGQIYISGLGVINGYETEDKHLEKFVVAPWNKEELLYATGDMGAWNSDGELIYLGRNDNQIKINGQRIEPEELEVRAQSCSDVESCIVSLCKNKEGKGHLVLYYTVRPGKEENAEESVRNYMKKIFPPSLVPHQYVRLDKIPLTSNGKKDRKHLPLPVNMQKEFVQNVNITELEASILEVWKRTLGRENISVKEHFFEAGGTSLLLYKLKSGIDAALGTDIDLVSLLDHTTVQEQAEWLSGDVKKAERNAVASHNNTVVVHKPLRVQRNKIMEKRKQLLGMEKNEV